MKKINLVFLFLLSILINSASAQGIEFFHGTWKEALAKAKQEEKIIFLDAYASWCGPCKRMAAEVFTLPQVGEFYNKNFICMKLDMETVEAAEVRDNFPVSAYPTLMFIDANSKLIQKAVGGQQPQPLIDLGKKALSKVDYTTDYAKKYTEGDRSPELIYNYIRASNKSNKPNMKVANDYLNTQKDLTTPFNLRFILEAASEADSRIFDLLIKNKTQIAALESEQAVKNKIEQACANTVKKAILFKSEDLLAEAKRKMKQNYSEKYEIFEAEQEVNYYKETATDTKKYLKALDNYVNKVVKEDVTKLNITAKDLCLTCPKEPAALKQAEKYAEKAAEKSNDANYYLTYADILLRNGKKSDALRAAKKSLELSKKMNSSTLLPEQMIQKIEKS